mmetsp:Transcript_63921/g.187496  ORF Transcript_63921/g.187496 Transcript_63921/m.187496 type:complete len:893 (-) Transcript_63921:164-2842(-)
MSIDEVHNPFTVVVCGGGNASQVAAALFGARYRTIVVSLFEGEAAKWNEALGDDNIELELDNGKVVRGRPDKITDDPSVAKEADCIVLSIPSFAHGQYLQAFAPHVRPGTLFAGVPTRWGLGPLAELGDKAQVCTFIGFETLPWACRFTEWGRKATILAAKRDVAASVMPSARGAQATAMLQGLLGVFPGIIRSQSLVGVCLRGSNMLLHPGIMYGRWCQEEGQWDGEQLDEKPLFYQGVDDFTEGVLLALSGEVQAVRRKLEEAVPGLDLWDAVPLRQWYLDSYAGQMADTSSLGSCMRTNAGYRGLTHPMVECLHSGKTPPRYLPDFQHRYLAEDVPGGMCFYRGLAEILGVPTPTTDKVLTWAQSHLGLEFLHHGKMCGADVTKTRAPQAEGIRTLPQFLEAAEIDVGALRSLPKLDARCWPARSAAGMAEASSHAGDPIPGDRFHVLVCGAGTTAQVATAMFSLSYHTVALTIHDGEAERWSTALADEPFELTLDTGKKVLSRPEAITDDPSVAAKADVVVIAVPSFAHERYFEALAPYLRKNCVVAAMPARSGADLLFAAKLGEKTAGTPAAGFAAKSMTFVGFESVPWACSRTVWGCKAAILGTKEATLAAVTPRSRQPLAFAVLQGLMGVFPHITAVSSNLAMSLRNPAAVLHPGMMYGRWCEERWDGQPLSERPLLYEGVDDFTEEILVGLSDEVQAIRRKVEERAPGVDMSDAIGLQEWYMERYAGHVTDLSSLRARLRSNRGATGVAHPMHEHASGKFMPNLTHKFLAEDVRTGLCFNRGLAELLGVPTPTTDKVLRWAQHLLGMVILVDGKMCGPDVAMTRAPQGMGITTFPDFCKAAGIATEGFNPDAKRKAQPPKEEKEHEHHEHVAAKRFKHCFLYPV